MDRPLKAQLERLEAAERRLVQNLANALERYDEQAAAFGVPLPDGQGGCPCPPCGFLRACRALVGAWEDQHGPVVR